MLNIQWLQSTQKYEMVMEWKQETSTTTGYTYLITNQNYKIL